MPRQKLVSCLCLALSLLLGLPQIVRAQNADPQHFLQGYAFLAPSVAPRTPCITSSSAQKTGVDTGFGAEAFFFKGLGAEAEAAYFGPCWHFNSNGMGVGSVDAVYRIPIGRTEPYAAGGYSVYFGHRGQNGYNLGGGVNIWFTRHAALRLGVRYQGDAGDLIPSVSHFVAFRIGVTFR